MTRTGGTFSSSIARGCARSGIVLAAAATWLTVATGVCAAPKEDKAFTVGNYPIEAHDTDAVAARP